MNDPADTRLPPAAPAPPATSASVAGWLQEFIPYGLFTTDRELRVSTWNQWLVTHSGRSADEVMGCPLSELYPGFDDRRLQRYISALNGEVSVLSAALHQHLLPFPNPQDEARTPYMLQTARIAPLLENGAIVGTITVIEDVTQREVQASVLHRQQELDRLLSETLGALLRSGDPARDVADIFPILLPPLGLDMHVSYLVSADRLALHLNGAGGLTPAQRETLATLALEPEDLNTSTALPTLPKTVQRYQQKLAELGLGSSFAFPLVVANRVIGLLAFGSYERKTLPPSDTTVLARISQYVAIALDRSMRERDILAASRAKDDFLAALSHELRTPLNPVLLLASESAANPEYAPEVRDAFRVIEKNALLEARLIDDLLDLTRIEHGKTNLEVELVDLHVVLRDTLVTVRADPLARELEINLLLEARPWFVKGDAVRLQQVFWNLLKNAVKFTPPGGCVLVRTSVDRGSNEMVVEVVDTGIGIAATETDRIFSAFVQAQELGVRRTHRFGGLGLGLAISRKLVELHGGRIIATSPGPDLGSTFTVRLPLATQLTSSSVPAPVPSSAIAESENAPRSASPFARVLLVEDHEPTRLPLTRLLSRRGFEVVAVSTMAEALEASARRAFDLVLSDIGLPDGDGFELMRTLRERGPVKGIALTGFGTEEDMVRSADAGFLSHLTKPIGIAALDRALAAAFAHGSTAG